MPIWSKNMGCDPESRGFSRMEASGARLNGFGTTLVKGFDKKRSREMGSRRGYGIKRGIRSFHFSLKIEDIKSVYMLLEMRKYKDI